MVFEKPGKLASSAILGLHGVADVGAVEAVDERGWATERQPGHDLCPGAFVGGGGEGHARDAGERFRQHVKAKVILTEVVSPLRHAVRLVDGDERDLYGAQELECFCLQQPLRSEIDEIELVLAEGCVNLLLLPVVERGVQKRSLHPELAQGRHLVLHQRDEG